MTATTAAPGACACGLCGRRGRFPSLLVQEVRRVAYREGWRPLRPWGWLCPTCALGAPGVHVQNESARRARDARHDLVGDVVPELLRNAHLVENDRIRRPSAEDQTPVRGFGWKRLGDVLDQLLQEETEKPPS